MMCTTTKLATTAAAAVSSGFVAAPQPRSRPVPAAGAALEVELGDDVDVELIGFRRSNPARETTKHTQRSLRRGSAGLACATKSAAASSTPRAAISPHGRLDRPDC